VLTKKTVAILQPQFFPWRGVFEQIRLADEFVHFDDVQFPQGRSFVSRVQIKSPTGIKWLTVPVKRSGLVSIDSVPLDDSQPWRTKHLRTLAAAYAKAPYVRTMLELVDEVYAPGHPSVADLNISAIEKVSAYLGLTRTFTRSSATPCDARSSAHLVALCKARNAERYVSGHGALKYLDESLFAQHGIEVAIMDYRCTPYPQVHGEFDPYVSILDLIANVGPAAPAYLDSAAVRWADVVENRAPSGLQSVG
jgi:hypothetical protein